MSKFRLGTRGSPLAVAQANVVRAALEQEGFDVELKIVRTSGDMHKAPLQKLKEFGVFVKELDEYLLRGRIDAAVHSLKDIPSSMRAGLEVSAVLPRGEPYEAFVSRGRRLKELEGGSVVGTSSVRRRAQILRFRSDVVVKELRGNLNTRLRKLKDGLYDGVVVAEVGLRRLSLIEEDARREGELKNGLFFERLPLKDFVPAANQGIIAVVARKGSKEAAILRELLDDAVTRMEAEVERRILRELGGGCRVPIGVLARFKPPSRIEVLAEVLSADGRAWARVERVLPVEGAAERARGLARELRHGLPHGFEPDRQP
ncbi:MAG: hydroxymethylbilane synthase [Candidatus Alkanophagales archaeon]